MIFRQWQQVLEGTKTQTRRLVKSGEQLEYLLTEPNAPIGPNAVFSTPTDGMDLGRTKWVIGRTYGVQPGRGQKAVGRCRIFAIRQELLQDISEEDAIAEGIKTISPEYRDFGKDHLYAWADGEPAYLDYQTGNWHKQRGDSCCCHEGQECHYSAAVCSYKSLWDSIHTKSGTRWADNPLVFVLEFSLVDRSVMHVV
jgi:hypothetical protein